MALKDIAAGRTDIYRIDPRLLKIKDGWNSRDLSDPANQAHVEELSLSIAEIGVKRPIVVSWENNEPFVTDGHCRYFATMKAIERGAEIKTVPVIPEDRYSSEADRIFTQIIHNAGKPLTSIEQAKVFKRLIDFGWKGQDIAAKAGISASRVSQILDLLTLPEPVKAMVTAGSVSASLALQTVKSEGEKAVETLSDAVETAKAEGKTKVLPKHMSGEKPAKVNVAKIMKETIEAAIADGNFTEEENMVTVSFTEEQWTTILNTLKL